MKYYLTLKKERNQDTEITWLDLEDIILSLIDGYLTLNSLSCIH